MPSTGFVLSVQLALQAPRNLAQIRRQLQEALGGFDLKIKGLEQLGATAQEAARVRAEVTKLSTSLGVSASALASVSQQLKQAGVAGKDFGATLKAVAQASLAPGFGNLQQVAAGSVSALKAFRLEAGQLPRVLGTVSSLSQTNAISAQSLLDSVAKLGAGFKRTGGTIHEFSALMASLKDETGQTAESVSSGLTQILSRIQRPATLNNLKKLGIDLRDAKGEFIGDFSALQKVSSTLNSLSPNSGRYAEIAGQLGGSRNLARVSPLLKAAADSRKNLTIALLAGVPVEQQARLSVDTLSGSMSRLSETFGAVQRAVLADSGIRTLADYAVKGATAVAHLADTLRGLGPLIGVMGGLALGGLGLRGLRAVGWGKRAGIVGTVAAGIGSAAFTHLLGAPSEAVTPRQQDMAITGAGFSGAFSGAAIGGIAGAYLGGPFAALTGSIGTAAGALIGFAQATKDAKIQIAEANYNRTVQGAKTHVEDFVSGGFTPTPARMHGLAADLRNLETEARAKAVRSGDFFRNLEQSRKDTFNPLSSLYVGAANHVIEQAAGRRGATTESVMNDFRGNELGGQVIEWLTRTGHTAQDVDHAFRQLAQSTLEAVQAEKNRSRLASSEAASSFSLSALARGLTATNNSLGGLQTRDLLLGHAFSGAAAVVHRPSLVHDLEGGPGFGPALSRTTALLGPYGGRVRQLGTSAEALRQSLPHILDSAANAPEGKLTESVVAALSQNKNILPQHVSLIESHLEAMGDKIQDHLSRGVDAFAQELMGPAVRPVEAALKTMADALQKRSQEVDAAAREYQVGLTKIIHEQNTLGELAYNQRRFRAGRQADEAGRPSSVLDFLPRSADLEGFRRHQVMLSGLPGEQALDPNALAVALRRSLTESQELLARRNASAPGSAEGQKLSVEFSRTVSETTRLQEALKNLTDTTKQTAAAHERLSKIESDRSSRLSFGEHFLGSDLGGRSSLLRGLALARIAHRQGGNVANFGVGNQRLLLDTLNSLGHARLTGLGGTTALDFKNQIIARTLPGVQLDANTQNDRKGLLDEIEKINGRAVEAQGRLIDVQKEILEQRKALQEGFFGKAEGMNEKFLSGLRQLFEQQEHLASSARVGQLRGNLGEYREQQSGLDLINRVGLDQRGLDLLRADKNQTTLGEYADAYRRLQEQDVISGTLRGAPTDLQAFKITDVEGRNRRAHDQIAEFSREQTPEQAEALARAVHAMGADEDIAPAVYGHLSKLYGQKNYFEIEQQARRQGVTFDQANSNIVRGLLPEAVARAQYERLQGARQAVAGKRGELLERTNIPAATLDKFLHEFVTNQKAASQALNIKDISDLTSAIQRLTSAIENEKVSQRPGYRAFREASAAGYAHGGLVGHVGPRPHHSDTVPARLTPGEFVVRAAQARKHRDALEAINSGRLAAPVPAVGAAGLGAWMASAIENAPLLALHNGIDHANARDLRRAYYNQIVPLVRYQKSLVNYQSHALARWMKKHHRQSPLVGQLDHARQILAGYPISATAIRHLGVDDIRSLLHAALNGQPAPALHLAPRPAAHRPVVGHANTYIGPETPHVQHSRDAQIEGAAQYWVNRERAMKRGYIPETHLRIGPTGRPYRFADGGLVTGGSGGIDDVHARLSRGEYVLNRGAVRSLGVGNLDTLNRGGHPASSRSGGGIALQVPTGFTRALGDFTHSMSELSHLLTTFSGSASTLAKAMESIPHAISMQGQHQHTHTHFGLEVFANASREFEKIAEGILQKSLSRLMDEKFAAAGPF